MCIIALIPRYYTLIGLVPEITQQLNYSMLTLIHLHVCLCQHGLIILNPCCQCNIVVNPRPSLTLFHITCIFILFSTMFLQYK